MVSEVKVEKKLEGPKCLMFIYVDVHQNRLTVQQRESVLLFKLFGFFFCLSTIFNTASSNALRFHCVGGCWDRTQDSCEYGIGCQTLQPLGYRSHPQVG